LALATVAEFVQKGPKDAAGGLLKNQGDMAVIRGKVEIRSARELFEFAENNQKTSQNVRILCLLCVLDTPSTSNIPCL
jgi:hypothetical protein